MNDESYKIKEKEKEENIFLAHFIEWASYKHMDLTQPKTLCRKCSI